MPSITDGEIRSALKRIEQSGKQEMLVHGDGHGTGRLILVLKPMPTRVTADWMAQQWRDGKRVKKKIGSYPSMSLANAREIFDRDFAKIIQKGFCHFASSIQFSPAGHRWRQPYGVSGAPCRPLPAHCR